MAWIALVGLEIEENLSLHSLCSSLLPHGFSTEIIADVGERLRATERDVGARAIELARRLQAAIGKDSH